MLRRIGVFHFGNPDKSQPLVSLQRAIEAKLVEEGKEYLKDSLLALPEAFVLDAEGRLLDRLA